MKKSLKGIIAGVIAMLVLMPIVYAETCTVTFDTKGGSAVNPVEVEESEYLNLPANPTKDGYTFVGWTTDEDNQIDFAADYDPIYTDKTLYAKWISNDKVIKSVNIKVTLPEVGTEFVNETNPSPNITLEDGANYTVGWTMYINNYPSVDPTYDSGEIFGTKVEEGKSYFIEVYLQPKEGFVFDDKDNVTLKVNNGTEYEINDHSSSNSFGFFAKISPNSTDEKEENKEETKEEAKTEETTAAETKAIEVLDGKDQKFDATKDDRLRFRFNLDYAEFKKSGKIFMDGQEVDSKNYESEEGSTIIIFTKAYTDTLKAGNHTVKLTSDEGEATADFTITKTVKNPQTVDNIGIYVTTAIISLIGIACVSLKKRFN